MEIKYNNITVSGKVATGTTTLAKNIKTALGWKHINTGDIQRRYDRKHNIHEDKQGASARPDYHEIEIDEKTKKLLLEEKNLIYEAWLAGFMAQDIKGVFKVLVVCSNFNVIVDRVVNRENIGVQEAREWIKQREEENIKKWKKLYKTENFWNPRYYDLVIDTYQHGPMESLGKVLDTLGVSHVV